MATKYIILKNVFEYIISLIWFINMQISNIYQAYSETMLLAGSLQSGCKASLV